MSPFPGHHLSETTWRRGALVAFVALTAVFAVLLYRAERHTGNVESRVTRIESPCLRYGSKSPQCKKAFEQAVLTITHPEACAILRKAGLEISPCAHARLRQEHRRGAERAATTRQASARGGDAHQTGSTGHQQPAPSSGGADVGNGAGKGGHRGGHSLGQNPGSQSPAPTPEANSDGHEEGHPAGHSEPQASTSSPGNSEGAGSSEEAPANPIAEGAGKALEDVGGVVKETGETANGAVGKASEGVGQVAEGAVCGSFAAPGCAK